jgi:hypothetical protein
MQRLEVSANRRFLIRSDGTPFLWLADTAWALALNTQEKQNLKRAGLDPNYTSFYRDHEILAHDGQDYEEVLNGKS